MRNVSTRFFVDSNILAYAYDLREEARRLRAVEVLDILQGSGTGIISIQVLGELYSAMTDRHRLGLPRDVAEASLLTYVQTWPVLDVTSLHVAEALRGVRQHQLPYWDALIWATARMNGIPFLLSEDGQDGRNIEGVRTLNPLKDTFDLDVLR
jgi:predicted nucleic acid-binding protein